MKKIGIKKTWGNIIMLFVIGMVIGVVIALRQPMPVKKQSSNQTAEIIVPDVQNMVENQQASATNIQESAAVSDTNENVAAHACDGTEPTCEISVNQE